MSVNYRTTRFHFPDNNTFLMQFDWYEACTDNSTARCPGELYSWRPAGNRTVIYNPLAHLSEWRPHAVLLRNRILPRSPCFLIQTTNRNMYWLSIFIEFKFALPGSPYFQTSNRNMYPLSIFIELKFALPRSPYFQTSNRNMYRLTIFIELKFGLPRSQCFLIRTGTRNMYWLSIFTELKSAQICLTMEI
jgi:hypothetical protein